MFNRIGRNPCSTNPWFPLLPENFVRDSKELRARTMGPDIRIRPSGAVYGGLWTMRDCGKGTGEKCPIALRTTQAGISAARAHKKFDTVPRSIREFTRFAQENLDRSKTTVFKMQITFKSHFSTIRFWNIFSAIVRSGIYGVVMGITFKCPAVLYVDPQKSDDEPTKPLFGTGVGSEGKTMQATRYKYLHNLHCKPVNA